jgi:hypothetical protein
MQARKHPVITRTLHARKRGGRKLDWHFLKQTKNFFLWSASAVLVFYLSLFVAERSDTLVERGNYSPDTLAGDRRLLEELFQKPDQTDGPGRQTSLPPGQNISQTTPAMESSSKPVARAVLVVNSELVKRGELIVRSGTIRRKHQNLTP